MKRPGCFLCMFLTMNAFAECSEIGVYSSGAEYLVLDPGTLATRESGNLHRLGIRGVEGVIPGSSVKLAAIGVERFVRVDGSFVHEGSRTSPWRGLFVMPDMGRSYAAQDELVYMADAAENRWVHEWAEGTLLNVRWDWDAGRKVLTHLDSSLRTLSVWETTDLSIGDFTECRIGETLIVSGLDSRLAISEGQAELQALEGLDRTPGAYRMTDKGNGCKTLINLFPAEDKGEEDLQSGILDIASKEFLASFVRRRFVESVLYADAGRLFEQQMRAMPEDLAARVYRMEASDVFRIRDTASGDVLLERSLGTGKARLAETLSCDAGSERVLLREGSVIYLVDINSLSVLASRELPFEGFFLF